MDSSLKIILITLLAIGGSTVFGALGGLVFRRLPHRYNDLILGSAAGIMLAAAILGLIQPAIEIEGNYTVILVLAGVFCGATLVSILDKITPHLHRLAGLDSEEHKHNEGTSKLLLFVSAIAIHKLPEGLAAGVSFGSEDLGSVLTVAGSISLQNIPEAMVIVAPLLSAGVSMKRTILISILIGFISMVGTLGGYFLVSIATHALPFLLSFAGGTMLYVISDEMIPETHSHGYEKQATFALISGFMLILILQQFV